MKDMRIGGETVALMPQHYAVPGRVKMTRSQAFYPATGLLEERITLETVDQLEWIKLQRHGGRKLAVLQ